MLGLYGKATGKFNNIDVVLRTLGSTGCQPVVVGSLPTTVSCIGKLLAPNVRGAFRQAAEKHRLAARAPRNQFIALPPLSAEDD